MVSRRKQSRRTTDNNITEVPEGVIDEPQAIEQNEPPPQHVLPDAVRDRQRAVAEREASRLARPDGSKSMYRLSHADRKKSAVTSTPSGFVTLPSSDNADTRNSANDNTEEWCGPWSVARQMISKREDARRRREESGNDENVNSENHPLDTAMEEFALEQQRKAHPSMQWKSSLQQLGMKRIGNGNMESLYRKRQKRMNVLQNGKKVPTLFNLCVTFLADNVDFIESLGIDTDSDIRTAVMDRLIADQLLNDAALDVLAEVGIDTLEISDGSNITENCLAKRLEILLPAGLKNVKIDQCGRCFTSVAVQAMTTNKSAESKIQVKNLMIGGAYGLQDIDAANLVKHLAPPTLGFKACNLLGKLTCQSLCDTYVKSSPLIELFLEDIPLTSEDLNVMGSKQNSWNHLKRLSLRRINGLDDTFLHGLFGMCCNSLEYLDLTDNFQLTDAILASLRFHNVAHRLVSLNLQGLKQLSPFGLEAFFTVTEDEMATASHHSIRLQQLNLGQCRHDAVTDEVIRLVVGAAPIDTLINEAVDELDAYQGNKNYKSLNSGGLVSLNVQGSSCISDTALEYLVSKKGRTYQTLKELNVSFCPRISDQGLGYLIDNCQVQLSKIEVWGNAQLTDNLYDGHQRIDDSRLEIVGVWMKKATSRTIR